MTLNEFNDLKNITEDKKIITGKDLSNQHNRTLLYGYTCERDMFHVYLQDGTIYGIIYDKDYSGNEPRVKNIRKIIIESNNDYVPNKRLYPETCDFEFCGLLQKYGVCLPFTTWDNKREQKQYYGFVKR